MEQRSNENISWKKYTLDQLGEYYNGRAFKKEEWKKDGLPIIRIQNLNNPNANFNYTDKIYESRYKVTHGDLLVSWAASLGVYVWDGNDAWLNQHIFKVEPNRNLITKDFLYYLLESVMSELFSKAHGTGMVHITKNDFDSQEVYVPSLSKQEIITKKLNSIFPMAKTSSKSILSIKSKIKKFRQGIITAAFTGKLTEDWRKKYKSTKKVHSSFEFEEDLPEIPDEWTWITLGEIADLKGGVTKGRNLVGKSTITLPYLRVANVQDGYLDLSVIKNIEIPAEEKEKYLLKKGDILFTEGGDRDKLGRGTIWNEEINNCIHQNHIFRARVNNPQVLPEFISLATKSSHAKRYFLDNASQTVNLASINITVLRNVPISIPSLEEQKEIISRVQRYFDVASQIEHQIENAEAKLSKLTQAILAKTFRAE
jgi:type I restriction enzyme S subunit